MVYVGSEYQGIVSRDACGFGVGVEEQGEDDCQSEFERGTLDFTRGEYLCSLHSLLYIEGNTKLEQILCVQYSAYQTGKFAILRLTEFMNVRLVSFALRYILRRRIVTV